MSCWLRRVVSFRGQRLTLSPHLEILILGGWIALLLACVEYDTGKRQQAETTRQAALSLRLGDRRSTEVASLLMVSRDLTRVLNEQYPSEPQTHAYLEQIHALSG